MEKSEIPTSQFKVFCDYFDTSLEAKLHKTKEDETKLLLTMETEKGEKEISLSLYEEDVAALIGFLTSIQTNIQKR